MCEELDGAIVIVHVPALSHWFTGETNEQTELLYHRKVELHGCNAFDHTAWTFLFLSEKVKRHLELLVLDRLEREQELCIDRSQYALFFFLKRNEEYTRMIYKFGHMLRWYHDLFHPIHCNYVSIMRYTEGIPVTRLALKCLEQESDSTKQKNDTSVSVQVGRMIVCVKNLVLWNAEMNDENGIDITSFISSF